MAAFANYSVNTQSPSNQSTQQAPSTPSAPSQPAATSNSGTRVFASPLAKSVAGQNNVPLSSITGSGPNSRILKQDVDEFIAKGSASVQPTTTASSSTEKASTSEAAVKTPAAKP